MTLAIDALQPGRYQPRTRMDPDALAELAESIKAQGLMQPILTRPLGAGRYEIEIAGRRHGARPSLRPLYDPEGARIRA